MNTTPLPYEPPKALPNSQRSPLRAHSLLLKAAAVVSILITVWLFVLQPDLEAFLNQHAAGRSMPDAFAGLNGTIPVFMVCLTITLILLTWIDSLRRPVLAVPALAGPIMGVIGWAMISDLRDPNWFHFFALTTIGLFVSGVVTFFLTLVVVVKEYWEGKQMPSEN